MTIIFTPEELEYIDKKPFNWALKDGAPEEIAESIKEKLALLNGKKGHDDGGPGSGNWGHEGREGEVGGSAPGQEASETAKAISSILNSKSPDEDSFDVERKVRKSMESAKEGDSFYCLYGGKIIEYRKKNSYKWQEIESFTDGRDDKIKDASEYIIAENVVNGMTFCETKADVERILKKTRSENLAGTNSPAKKDLDKLNEICAKHSSAQFRTGDSNEIRKNAREEAASEMASVLDGMEDGTVLYYNNESRNGPGWFTYAIKKDGNTWKYVEPNTGTTEDAFGTSAEVSQNFMEYHRNLGFSTDYESAQENKKALDKRISDLNSTPVDMSDAKASKEVHAPKDGKITYNSPDFGKPGKYVMYRQGNLGNNSMMFFAPMKEGADLYASARSLGDEGPTGQYEVEIKNPLIIKGGGDSECINKAYAALHPDKPKLVQNGSQWKKADAENASALNKSEYDAIIYIINGKPSEIQVTKKRIKDVKKTGSYTTTEWSRIGLTMEEAKRKGFYDRDPHDYERVDGRFDSDDNEFDPDDLYYFLKDWKFKRSENEDGGPGSGNFEWITVNGTHIPIKDGDLQGKVGDKIEKESKEPAEKLKYESLGKTHGERVAYRAGLNKDCKKELDEYKSVVKMYDEIVKAKADTVKKFDEAEAKYLPVKGKTKERALREADKYDQKVKEYEAYLMKRFHHIYEYDIESGKYPEGTNISEWVMKARWTNIRGEDVERAREAIRQKEKAEILRNYDQSKKKLESIQESRKSYDLELQSAKDDLERAVNHQKEIISKHNEQAEKWNKAVLEKFPNIDAIKNPEDATEYMLAKGYVGKNSPRDYSRGIIEGEPFGGSPKIDFDGMDLNGIHSFCRAFDMMAEKTPGIANKVSLLSVDETTGDNYGTCSPYGAVSLNMKEFSKAEDVNRAFGWFHPAIKSKDPLAGKMSVVAHESGHALDFWLASEFPEFAEGVYYAGDKDYKGRYMLSVAPKIIKHAAKKLGITVTELKENISQYACKNSIETLAEAYSEFVISDTPRPEATEIGRLINSLLETRKLA